MNLKTLQRWSPGRHERRQCDAAGCRSGTKGGKQFCSSHVDLQPYVQDLLAQLAAQEEEIANVRRVGARAVDPSGIQTQEILSFLRVHGDKTVRGLARELNLEVEVARAYGRSLKRRGLVSLSKNKRGATLMRLRSKSRKPRPQVATPVAEVTADELAA